MATLRCLLMIMAIHLIPAMVTISNVVFTSVVTQLIKSSPITRIWWLVVPQLQIVLGLDIVLVILARHTMIVTVI